MIDTGTSRLQMPISSLNSAQRSAQERKDAEDIGLSRLESADDETSEISSLAKQLAEAALRATERYGNLPRKELGKYAWAIIERLCGASYRMAKGIHDAEVPIGDAARLARAEQATAFTNRQGPNPFAGLTDEQLTLIAFDEGGDFTMNERAAAQDESSRRSCAWTFQAVAQMQAERSQTGRTTESLKGILDYYQKLPVIELALYPFDPIANTQSQIAQEQAGAGAGSTSLAEFLTRHAEQTELRRSSLLSPDSMPSLSHEVERLMNEQAPDEVSDLKLDVVDMNLFMLMAQWDGRGTVALEDPTKPEEPKADKPKGEKPLPGDNMHIMS